jgi:hypothetical protein
MKSQVGHLYGATILDKKWKLDFKLDASFTCEAETREEALKKFVEWYNSLPHNIKAKGVGFNDPYQI